MLPDSGPQSGNLVRRRFADHAVLQIPVAQVGNGGDDQVGVGRSVEVHGHDLVGYRLPCPPDHVDVEVAQQGRRRVELGGAIVVASYDHGRLTAGFAQPAQEMIVLVARLIGRVHTVEHVSRYDQDVDGLRFYGCEQPLQGPVVFGGTVVAVQTMPQVPVGRVQDTDHAWPVNFRCSGFDR